MYLFVTMSKSWFDLDDFCAVITQIRKKVKNTVYIYLLIISTVSC